MIDLTSIGFITITAWIVLAATGIVVTTLNLWDSWFDLVFVKESRIKNGRVLIAKVALVSEATRLVAHVLMLVAGILVAAVQFNPEPPPASLYVRSAILATLAILVSHTIIARWLRRRLTAQNNDQ